MARIIPQTQPDPFAPQVAGLHSTRQRPYQGFQTANKFLDTAAAVANSPLTGLALRGIQAGAGGVSDMLADAAARRVEEYKAGNMDLDRMAELAAPEPYKPMEGLSLSGKEPKGLGLSLRDMPEQAPPQGWSSESRLGELQGALGDDLARAAQRKLGIAPQPSSIGRSTVGEVVGAQYGNGPSGQPLSIEGLREERNFLPGRAGDKYRYGASALAAQREWVQKQAEIAAEVDAFSGDTEQPEASETPKPDQPQLRAPQLPKSGPLSSEEIADIGSQVRGLRQNGFIKEDEYRLTAERLASYRDAIARGVKWDGGAQAPGGASILPPPALPPVPRTEPTAPLPTAEQLGERRRNPPLSLALEPAPPRPPIATQTEGDAEVEQRMRDEAWRKFSEGDDGVDVNPPTLQEDLQLDMVPGLSDLPQPELAVEDVQIPSADLEGVAEAAPVLGRSERLSKATDEQLNSIRNSLQGDDPETLRRIAQIDRELQQRADVTRVAERALTPEDLLSRAKLANTPELQAQAMKDSARVRMPITSVADLIGDQREKAFRQELNTNFPSAPKKTAEQIAADIALLDARGRYYAGGAAERNAKATGIGITAPAQANKANAEGARALAQGGTEESKRELNRSNAGLADEKAIDLAATRKGRLEELQSRAARANAAAKKLTKETDAIAKKMAEIRRGGPSAGAGIDALLKQAERVGKIQMGETKEAKESVANALKVANEATNDANALDKELSMAKSPGNKPTPPAKNASPQEMATYTSKLAEWEAGNDTYSKLAVQRDRARAWQKIAGDAVAAALKAERDLAGNARKFDPVMNELLKRAKTNLGLTPATPGAAPATVEGQIYMVNGKKYVGKNGKLEAVP